jgi:hypothetical protein
MNRTKHKDVKVNSYFSLTRSVSDIRALFEGKANKDKSPQLVKYRRHSSTYRSTENVAIYISPPKLYTPDQTVSCPNSPLQQASTNNTMEMSKNLITNITKAACDIVGVGQQQTNTDSTVKDTKPKLLKQATLTFEGRIGGVRQPVTTTVSTSLAPKTPQSSSMTANSFLTASTADTPLSDHGSWAQDTEDQVLLSDIPGQGYKQHVEMYVDPVTIPEELRGITALAPVTIAPQAVMTPTTTTGGIKRSLPFNTPVKAGSAGRGKSKKKEGKKSVKSSSADESQDDSPPMAETVRKKKQAENLVTPPPPLQQNTTSSVDQSMDTTGAQVGNSHLTIQEQLAHLAQRMDSIQLQLEQRVEGVQGNLSMINNDLRRMKDDIGQLNNDHLTACVTWQKTNEAVFELQDDRKKHSEKISTIEIVVGQHEAEIKGATAEISKLTKNQDEMKASIADLYKRVTTAAALNSNSQQDEQSASFFIGGLKQLREWREDYVSDPAELVADLLRYLHIYHSVTRISLADNESRAEGNRMNARAAIVVMNSQMHRRDAIIKLKRFLNEERKQGLEGVTAGDCFPHDLLGRVKVIGRYATAKKREGKFYRFRIINRNGQPILQTSKKNKPFEDANFTEEGLAPYVEETIRMDTDDPADREKTKKKQTHKPTTGANNQPVGQQQQQAAATNGKKTGVIPKTQQQQQQTRQLPQPPPQGRTQPQQQANTAASLSRVNQQQAPKPFVPQPGGNSAAAPTPPPQQGQLAYRQMRQQAPTHVVPQPGGSLAAPYSSQHQQLSSYRQQQQQQYVSQGPTYSNQAVNSFPQQSFEQAGPGETTAGFRRAAQLPPGMAGYIQQVQQMQQLPQQHAVQQGGYGMGYYPVQQYQYQQNLQQLPQMQYGVQVGGADAPPMENQPQNGAPGGATGDLLDGATGWDGGEDPNRYLSRDG